MTRTDNSLISKKVRNAFREIFSEYYVLQTIRLAFDNYGFKIDEHHQPSVSGRRREIVEQYYASIDFTSETDTERVLRVYSDVLGDLPCDNEKSKNEKIKLLNILKLEGYDVVDGRLASRIPPALVEIRQLAHSRNLRELERLIDRLMRTTAATDPALTVGTAKELVETVCKTILMDAGMSDNKMSLPKLVRTAAGVLSLLPEDIPDQVKGKDTIRRVLNSLTQIVDGIGDLRNLYGTGHGKHGGVRGGVAARHARLVVGAAGAVAMFLMETQSEQSSHNNATQ